MAIETCSGNNCDPIFTSLPIAFGEMYTVGVVSQTTITGPTQLTTFNMNGLSAGTTPNFALNRISIGDSGVYVVTFTIAFQAGNNLDWRFQVAVNNIPQSNIDIKASSEGTTTGHIMSAVGRGFLSLESGDLITILVSQSAAAIQTIDVESANLFLSRIQ